jgi:hypothetical protein
VYFKLIPTLNVETWTLRKRKNSKIQAMNMKVLKSIEEKKELKLNL